MPEHDTFDLDAAFRALEQDLATVSAAPGAAAAVTRARRRRRTTIGAVAAAAALVVGGVALTQGGDPDPANPPVSPPRSGPAELDAAHLTAATAGWTSAWTASSDGAMAEKKFGGTCFPFLAGDQNGMVILRTLDGASARGSFKTFGRNVVAQQAAWSSLQQRLASCPEASPVGDFSSDIGQGLTYRIADGAGSTPAYLWLVNTGTAVGVLKIYDQSDPLPASSNGPVTEAVLAGAADPATYPPPPRTGGKSSRIDPTKTVGFVWEKTLAPALAGWQSGWEHLSGVPSRYPPCTADIGGQGGTPVDYHISVGGNGHEWVQWHRSVPRAVAALDQIQRDLEQCATPSTFHTVTLDDARPILVGTGGDWVYWATRVSSHILVLALPAGSQAPPDDVSRRVGEVLEHVLEQPATTTMAPGAGVPAWMKPEIAAAPTFGP